MTSSTSPEASGAVVAAEASGLLDDEQQLAETLLTQYHRERARRQVVMGSIRAHLEEQPTPHAFRACARQWRTDIAELAETVVTAMNSTGSSE